MSEAVIQVTNSWETVQNVSSHDVEGLCSSELLQKDEMVFPSFQEILSDFGIVITD